MYKHHGFKSKASIKKPPIKAVVGQKRGHPNQKHALHTFPESVTRTRGAPPWRGHGAGNRGAPPSHGSKPGSKIVDPQNHASRIKPDIRSNFYGWDWPLLTFNSPGVDLFVSFFLFAGETFCCQSNELDTHKERNVPNVLRAPPPPQPLLAYSAKGWGATGLSVFGSGKRLAFRWVEWTPKHETNSKAHKGPGGWEPGLTHSQAKRRIDRGSFWPGAA